MAVIYDLDNEYGARIIGDGGEDTNLLEVRSASATIPAVLVSRSVAGAATIAPLRIANQSTASGALLGFAGGFISVTSILGFSATGSAIAFDRVIPIEVGGVQRGIPVTSLASLVGAGAF